MRSGHTSDPVEAAALRGRRFWVPRGTASDLSDNGFLFDPDSPRAAFAGTSAVPIEALANFPVLGLLGESGIGKSTVLKQETRRLAAAVHGSSDQVIRVDLAAYASDVLVCQKIFGSKGFRAWTKGNGRLHLLLDGFDTCLQHIEPLVTLLLERLSGV
jgi:hypothetical protein